MPKARKQNTRKPNERIFILCEGEKTEPYYFSEVINEIPLAQDLIEIIIYNTRKNTAKELVAQGKALKETPRDQVWVVVDKDGYTKHPESFDMANANNINIAFSSIAFETWVLMHFAFTTKQFDKSQKLISYINSKKYLGTSRYEKNLKCLYRNFLKVRTETAKKNARLLRKSVLAANPDQKIFHLNPYTDIDKLIKVITDAQTKFRKK